MRRSRRRQSSNSAEFNLDDVIDRLTPSLSWGGLQVVSSGAVCRADSRSGLGSIVVPIGCRVLGDNLIYPGFSSYWLDAEDDCSGLVFDVDSYTTIIVVGGWQWYGWTVLGTTLSMRCFVS